MYTTAINTLKQWAAALKRDVVAVYYAARDSRTPIMTKLLAMAVAAYAISPIDLIPDFIPVIGYLDDLIIVPLGLMLVIKLLPAEVLADARQKSQQVMYKPASKVAALAIVAVWVVCILVFLCWIVGISGVQI